MSTPLEFQPAHSLPVAINEPADIKNHIRTVCKPSLGQLIALTFLSSGTKPRRQILLLGFISAVIFLSALSQGNNYTRIWFSGYEVFFFL